MGKRVQRTPGFTTLEVFEKPVVPSVKLHIAEAIFQLTSYISKVWMARMLYITFVSVHVICVVNVVCVWCVSVLEVLYVSFCVVFKGHICVVIVVYQLGMRRIERMCVYGLSMACVFCMWCTCGFVVWHTGGVWAVKVWCVCGVRGVRTS